MSLTEDLHRLLSQDPAKSPLFSHASLEWHKRFGEDEEGCIVLWTDRQLTSAGGNGWDGFDSSDMIAVENAIQRYVDEEGAHMIKSFVVRQKRGIVPP